MFWIVPENSASPCAFRGTLAVFAMFDEPGVFWVASTALHTRVPITSVIGPGVPLNCAPLMASPSTSNAACPVIRSTRAWPLRTDHAKVPLSILATILETFFSLMTPTMFLQRTIASSSARAAVAVSEIAIAAAIAPGREIECIFCSMGCQGEASTAGDDCPSCFGLCNGRIGRAQEDGAQRLLRLWPGIHTSGKCSRVACGDAAPCR